MRKKSRHVFTGIILFSVFGYIGVPSPVLAQAAVYTNEAAYMADLAALGFSMFHEDFEGEPPWDAARTMNIFSPVTVPSITSQGIVWTSNHPLVTGSEITTSNGSAYEGDWGLYSMPHGDPTVTGAGLDCTVTPVPGGCLKHDGILGTRKTGEGLLYGVGGWVRGTHGGKLVVIVDGDEANPLNFGDSGKVTTLWQYFGVIVSAGFQAFEFRETEGAVGDEKYIFLDAFTFGVTALKGDMDSDGDVDLEDALLALMVITSTGPGVGNAEADVNGDGRIGMGEAIYILQKVSQLR